MSVKISCPVFRCAMTSVAQCTGYRRACERYYCQTHNEGTLCDRCVRLKQESLKAGYKTMLQGIVRRSYSEGLSGAIIGLVVVSVVLLGLAIVSVLSRDGSERYLPFLVVLLSAAVLGLIVAVGWYLMKTREFVRSESVALDLNHPGFYDYYREWQEKFDKITSETY